MHLPSCRPAGQDADTVALAEHFLHMLLVERLRTPADRLAVADLMLFRGFSLSQVAKPSTHITSAAFHVGLACLTRLEQGMPWMFLLAKSMGMGSNTRCH
jgi:hypothetical protein